MLFKALPLLALATTILAPGLLALACTSADRSARARASPLHGADDLDGVDDLDGSRAPPPLEVAPARPTFFAVGTDGAPLLADAATGEILATAVAPRGAVIRDLAWDPRGRRLISVEGSADDEGGAIAAYPLDGAGALGPREHLAWLDGDARVAPFDAGLVVLERSYGERWRALWNDGEPSASLPSPVPRSLEVGRDGAGGARLRGLGPGAGASGVERVEVAVDAHALAVLAREPLPGGSPSSRLARLGDRDIQISLDNREIVLCWPDEPRRAVVRVDPGVAVDSIEHAAPLDEGHALAVLTSGPALVVVARLGLAGALADARVVALRGDVGESAPFPSRAMIAPGPRRLLVATAHGVVALEVRDDEGALTVEVDEACDGRNMVGPLALGPSP
jgi:hypothetical protein